MAKSVTDQLYEMWPYKPYILVINEASNDVAVYNRKYELLRETASPALIAYAKTNYTQKENGYKLGRPGHHPSWINIEKGDGENCLTYWIYDDGTPLKKRKSIPDY